jgi:hypothetical protein
MGAMLTRNFYELGDVVLVFKSAVEEGDAEQAIAAAAELIASEEAEVLIATMIEVWAATFGTAWTRWLCRLREVCIAEDGVEEEDILYLCRLLAIETEGYELGEPMMAAARNRDVALPPVATLTTCNIAAIQDWSWVPDSLDTPLWKRVRRQLAVAGLTGPIVVATDAAAEMPMPAPRQLRIAHPSAGAEELADPEAHMTGCAVWDRLWEENGLDMKKGAAADYGNTAGYEAFAEEAYGELGWPDEWPPAEKAKSHKR